MELLCDPPYHQVKLYVKMQQLAPRSLRSYFWLPEKAPFFFVIVCVLRARERQAGDVEACNR